MASLRQLFQVALCVVTFASHVLLTTGEETAESSNNAAAETPNLHLRKRRMDSFAYRANIGKRTAAYASGVSSDISDEVDKRRIDPFAFGGNIGKRLVSDMAAEELDKRLDRFAFGGGVGKRLDRYAFASGVGKRNSARSRGGAPWNRYWPPGVSDKRRIDRFQFMSNIGRK